VNAPLNHLDFLLLNNKLSTQFNKFFSANGSFVVVRRSTLLPLVTTICHTVSGTLGVLLLTWGNPPGQRQLLIGISWDEYLSALLAGLLIAVAWAMPEAGRIEQDNAGFV
jgi:hypothetical protein